MANEELNRKILAGYKDSLETYKKRLADKQASEIFEGDVLRYVNTLAPHTETGTVEYFADWAMFGLKLKRFDVPIVLPSNRVADHISLEVLGNVHENPELVEHA